MIVVTLLGYWFIYYYYCCIRHLDIGFQLNLELRVLFPVSRQQSLDLRLVLLLPLLLALHVRKLHLSSPLEQSVDFRLFFYSFGTTRISVCLSILYHVCIWYVGIGAMHCTHGRRCHDATRVSYGSNWHDALRMY